MPNQESTAINDLIHLAQGRRLERISENPVPEVYVTAASLRPEPAPPRIASGTRPPPIAQPIARAQAPLAPAVPLPPQVAAPKKAQKKVYRIPANAVTSAAIEHDDEQTEQWNNADIATAPAVPSIAPHAATVIAAQHAPVIPAILRGPVGPENPVDRAAAARAAAERQVAEAAAASRAPQAHASHAHSRALPAPAMPVSMLPYPAFTIPVAPPSPVKPPSPASWLIAREVLTSWGSLAVIAAIALGIGVYVAIATKKTEPTVTAPTERDRAIAIMNGTAQPEPEHTVVHAPAAAEPVTAEAITTPRPAPFASVEPQPTGPTAEPIEPAVVATSEDAVPSDDAADADETIDADAIEIEPMNARPSKRAIRRAARAKAKREAIADKPTRAETRASSDPVLAILNEKPAKPTRFEKLAAAKAAADEKRLAEKAKKKVKEPTGAATEIAAPKGALAAKGTGKVMITSDVPALIFLDGRPTGKKSPSAFVVPAGDHQITLLDPASKKAKTATVQIAANKSVSVRKDFN